MPIKQITQIFKLKKYVIEKMDENGEEIRIHCHPRSRGMWYNGKYSQKVAETKRRRIAHMMLENQRVVLILEQRRFVFKGTKRWEILPDIQKGKQTTNTFRLHTLRELQRDNYSGSGNKRKMSGMFPMKILDSLEIDIQWRKGVKKVGLDGKCVKKHTLVHHISDLEKGKSMGVLPNLSQKSFKKNC